MWAKIIDGAVSYPPHNDGCAFNVDLSEVWLKSHGFVDMSAEQIAEASAVPQNEVESTVKKYSKYRLKMALQERGLWDEFKEALTEDEYETFLLVQELSSDDSNFQAILEKFKSINDYQSILSACEME